MNRVVRLADIKAEAQIVSDQEQEEQRTPEVNEEQGLNPEHLRMAEALLFAASEPLDAKALGGSLPEGANVPMLLAELQGIYEKRGVTLVCVSDKWQFRTAPDLAFLLRKEQPEQNACRAPPSKHWLLSPITSLSRAPRSKIFVALQFPKGRLMR